MIGGTLQGFFLGLFCFVAHLLAPDRLGEIAAVLVAMGSTVTIVGPQLRLAGRWSRSCRCTVVAADRARR